MAAPIFYGVNRLETATVTAASTVTNRPLVRLSDRFVGPRWEGTGPIVWDQGSALPYDAVLGAAGHNLTGATLTVQTDDNAGFATPTTLGSVVIASTDAFRITCTGSPERYNRMTIASGPSSIELAELWASVAVTAPRPPLLATSPNRIGNFTGAETEAGAWVTHIRSDMRWQAEWEILGFTRTVRNTFFDFFDAIGGGARPFFVLDDESVLRFARWLNPETAFAGMLPEKYQARFELREVVS